MPVDGPVPWPRLWHPVAPTGRHYFALDVLRGIGAVAVLFYHYQHFWMVAPEVPVAPAMLAAMPLASLVGGLYRYGHWAVEFFWILSGFVLAAAYAGRTPDRRRFAVARAARLYPLHLLTLGVVAVLQVVNVQRFGHAMIYGDNDPAHFVLNLGLASSWGWTPIHSFNGPVWSVSAEVLAYAVFAAVLPYLFRRGVAGPLLLSAAARAMMVADPSPLWTCIHLFFVGSALYALHATLARQQQAALAALLLAATAAAALAGFGTLLCVSAGSAALILGVAAFEAPLAAAALRMRWFGEATYGIYLWHIPVQLLLILTLPVTRLMASPVALVLFVAGMTAIGYASFRWIETPMRRWITRPLLWQERPA